MAQTSTKCRIYGMTTMNGASFTPVSIPADFLDCRRVRITNPDAAADIEVCTDTADADAIRTVEAGTTFELGISDRHIKPFAAGDVVCYVRGSGDQPKLVFEA